MAYICIHLRMIPSGLDGLMLNPRRALDIADRFRY
jgi:hypothetical protein